MPLYEYQCQECSSRFERIEKASAPHDGTCPECGGAAHRLLGVPALQFKGSGWYVTDYGKGNGGGPASSKNAGSDSAPESSPPKETSTPAAAKTGSDSKVA